MQRAAILPAAILLVRRFLATAWWCLCADVALAASDSIWFAAAAWLCLCADVALAASESEGSATRRCRLLELP